MLLRKNQDVVLRQDRASSRRAPEHSSERVKESSIANLYASPAKAGAYCSAARTRPRWQGIAIALKIPRGGGMDPGFSPESEGVFAGCMFKPISPQALRMRQAFDGIQRNPSS